jgi:hypothetical protein
LEGTRRTGAVGRAERASERSPAVMSNSARAVMTIRAILSVSIQAVSIQYRLKSGVWCG